MNTRPTQPALIAPRSVGLCSQSVGLDANADGNRPSHLEDAGLFFPASQDLAPSRCKPGEADGALREREKVEDCSPLADEIPRNEPLVGETYAAATSAACAGGACTSPSRVSRPEPRRADAAIAA